MEPSIGTTGATTTAVEGVMSAFAEFKHTNDARLAAIGSFGSADVLLDHKLARIETSFNEYEDFNQRLVLHQGQTKAMEGISSSIDVMVDHLLRQRLMDRLSPAEAKVMHNRWCRAVALASSPMAGNTVNFSDEQTLIKTVSDQFKALSIGTDTTAGYLAPIEYIREIIKGVTELSPARSIVRVRQTAGKAIQIPRRTGQFAARRTAEQATRTETTGLAYGLEELAAPEMYALIDISNQMLEDSAFDMEAELREEASEQFALKEGAEVVTGTGIGECEGYLTSTGVAETNSGTATTIADVDGQANGLITLQQGLKSSYARSGLWTLNRATLGSVRKLKDADKNYIWMPGITSGVPSTILGSPYVDMPDMPNEGAGTYPIAFGDFRRAYTLVDRIAMEVLRDPYTQATSGNTRFIFRRRVGGQVVLAEAIRKLKCAS